AFTVANTGPTQLFVNVTSRGVPEAASREPIREGIAVSRLFYTSRGQEYAETTYHQGESYVIELAIACERDIENAVVVDLLPAGFEIENPRLQLDVIPVKADDHVVSPTYLDVRDDRLLLAFDTLGKGEHRFFYVVRAVTPGVYQYPAVEAECMYDAKLRGASAVSAIRVE
ncbi:MAG TPA: hypothetical protein HPP77_00915, partial [Candidatus Hydrogenedentes bacterium]|nr:hypothetical protein [Candidatus Hydrogenedentota bacterium]